MSFPNIPDVTPTISIQTQEVINLLLASIAFEELGLSHIINSEAEKIQYVLGTLPGHTPPTQATADDLLKIDKAVQNVMRDVIKKEMLLQFKLEDVMNISTSTTTTSSSTTTTSSSTTTTSSSTTTTSSSTTTTSSSTTTTSSSTTTTSSSTTTTSSSTTTTSSSTTTTSSSTTTTSSSTTTTSSSTTTTSSSTTTTSSSTTTTSSSTTTTSSSTTTTSSTTTSTTSTSTSTTAQPIDVGSAWAVGTTFGQGNAQYVTFENNVMEEVVVLGLGKNNIPVGNVQILRAGNNLVVTYTTVSPYVMDQVHLYVDDVVPTNSAPGSFPYQFSVSNPADYFTTYTFVVDITAFAGETIYIAAHAHILQQV